MNQNPEESVLALASMQAVMLFRADNTLYEMRPGSKPRRDRIRSIINTTAEEHMVEPRVLLHHLIRLMET